MNRRLFLLGASAVTVLPAAGRAADPKRIEPVLLDDGRYAQSWFLTSFLVLKDDLAESTAQGKRLALLWDQRGCPYCKEMHRVNFTDPAVNAYIRERFNILQLDLNGAREVTDFDGQVLSEKELAKKNGVIGTPTIQFLPASADAVEGKSGPAVEVARMPGYFQPGLFEGMFAFVYDRGYETATFRQYMQRRAGRPDGSDKAGG
ncbi:MAG TPA: thioredoxin family protein [Alphaproteobacteria bacterium]